MKVRIPLIVVFVALYLMYEVEVLHRYVEVNGTQTQTQEEQP